MAKLYRARLVRGKFHEKVTEEGKEVLKTYDAKTRPVITSETDLVKTYGREKFEPIDIVDDDHKGRKSQVADSDKESGEAEVEDGYEFDTMTISQLKEFAEAEEIDLTGARTKDEIITVLTKAVESQR